MPVFYYRCGIKENELECLNCTYPVCIEGMGFNKIIDTIPHSMIKKVVDNETNCNDFGRKKNTEFTFSEFYKEYLNMNK